MGYDHMRLLALPCSLCALCLISLCGCGGKPAGYPDTAPVTGTVTLDGAPLEGASISFAPPKGRASGGTTDAEGKYELSYIGAVKGAMLGAQRVMISKRVPDLDYVPSARERSALQGEEFIPPLIETIPERYRGKSSELSAQVTDTDNVVDFALTSD